MTNTPSVLEKLIADCDTQGIRLLPANDGGLTIDAPQNALTPDLLAQLRSRKGELLAILRRDPNAPAIDLTDATAVWQAALDRLKCDPLFPPDEMEALRAADARWADEPEAGEADESTEVIDPPDRCPECGTLELWQSLAGNWRCLRCDPPTKARRLAEAAQRIRRRMTNRNNTRHNG